MNNWVYKCTKGGDWEEFFHGSKQRPWGNAKKWPQLARLAPGDLVLACQSSSGKLVGLTRVVRFKTQNQKTKVILEPLLKFDVSLKTLRENLKVQKIPAFIPGGAIGVLKSINQKDWETLLAAIRRQLSVQEAEKDKELARLRKINGKQPS